MIGCKPLGVQPGNLTEIYYCAACGGVGATMMIGRQRPGCPAKEADGESVAGDVAFVHARHFPPTFHRLPLKVRREAIALVWQGIDKRNGRLGVAVRVRSVRTPLRQGRLRSFVASIFTRGARWARGPRRAGRSGKEPPMT